jgi:uncharacterized protein (TIGR02001 family)
MTLSKLKLAVLGALVVPMTSVLAEEAPAAEAASDFSFSGNVGMYSDYIFRGYTQTKHQPALQGGFDMEHSSGLYLGTWASNVKWTTEGGYMDDNDLEIDVYGGWAGDLGPVSVDVGFLQFFYPGDNAAGGAEADASELYVGVSKDFGFASAGLTYYNVISTDAWGFTDAKGSEYLTLDVDVPVGDSITLSAHVGHQKFDGTNNSVSDYTDWKLNAEYAINDTFAVGAFYTDTDQDKSATVWTVNGEYLGESVGGAYLSAGF